MSSQYGRVASCLLYGIYMRPYWLLIAVLYVCIRVLLARRTGPLGMLVWGVFALVVAASVISGFQHFLLQRTGTAVVYSSRRKLIGRILHLPISEFDARRTGDLVSRVGTDTPLLYRERFIPGEIYRARPDVNAVVHSHSPTVV